MNPWMYVVLLGFVLIIYARLLPKSEADVQKKHVVQEIEETIEHFAVEMDEQNRAILDLFSKTKQDYEVELAKLSGRLETLEKQKSELSQELHNFHASGFTGLSGRNVVPVSESSQSPVIQASSPIEFPTKTGEEDHGLPHTPSEEPVKLLSMRNRYAELFSLYDQGKGVEFIAKKLGMNKGEVNLIIQLSRQEERMRVQK